MTLASVSYRTLLGVPGLRILLSRFATWMFMLTIVLYAPGRFESPVVAGWLAFAAMALTLIPANHDRDQ